MRRIPSLSSALAIPLLCLGSAVSGEPRIERDVFQFRDGGHAIYYEAGVPADDAKTLVFVYGGTGCYSWKQMAPQIAMELGTSTRVVALNKRGVSDEDARLTGCSEEFDQQDVPRQWVADYMEFLTAKLSDKPGSARNVVLLGVSEGGALAARVARSRSDITHLLVIGDGGWSMRDNLSYLIGRDEVEGAWRNIAADPNNTDRTWLGRPYRYWFDILDQEPMLDYLALDIPVLVAMGERDASVPAHSAAAIRTEAERAGKKNIGVVIYPGADHRLQADGHAYRSEFLRGAAQGISRGKLD